MKRVALFAMVAATIVSARTFLVAQSGPGGKHQPLEIARPTVQALPPTGLASVLEPTTPLQQRFMELSAKKAHLMTEEQLQQAVKALEQQVEGLTAWSKLEETARLLREVQEKHPQTKAAEVAKSALGIIEQNRPLFPDPKGRPVDDRPVFDKVYERSETPPRDPN